MTAAPLTAADLALPPAPPGRIVGLYGGSFNPPHRGHLHVARTALVRLGLDSVWWLVTPGNPLKPEGGTAPLPERLAAVRRLAAGPRMRVTGFEAAHGFRYTYETLRFLVTQRPHTRFVWIMGADSLATFDRWQRWRDIARLVPIAVVDRPRFGLKALASAAARSFADARVPERDAATLPFRAAPAWVFLHGPLDPHSSTALRAANGHGAAAAKP